MKHQVLARPIAFRNQLRDFNVHHASFIREIADENALSVKLKRRNDEASQDLFFACMSFVILLGIAVADVVFRI